MINPPPSHHPIATQCSNELKEQILAAIAQHLAQHGRHNWDLIRENPEFAAVIGKQAGEAGRRKFFRWVEAVSKPSPSDKTRPHEASNVATQALAAATERARLAAVQNLPAAPSPAYLMRSGADGDKNVDFLAGIKGIWADAELMRENAVCANENATGGIVITDMKGFNASIRRRVEIIEAGLRVMREIWDLEHQQQFYTAIVDIIVEELAGLPEIQARIGRRLNDLNNKRGMTPATEAR